MPNRKFKLARLIFSLNSPLTENSDAKIAVAWFPFCRIFATYLVARNEFLELK
jgi:hypothetical protein